MRCGEHQRDDQASTGGPRRGLRLLLVVSSLCALGCVLAPVTQATPTVSTKDVLVPIPGFSKTGNLPGAGTAIEQEITIAGTEYGGFPPPVEQINMFLPEGLAIDSEPFPTCSVSALELSGPSPDACPKGSAGGPIGSAEVQVAFGTEVVPEQATFQAFYAPGGGVNFFLFGHEPVILEVISQAGYQPGGTGYGEALDAHLPLIETVPGAPDTSLERLKFKLGSALKTGKAAPSYYFRAPGETECPKGYLPFKTEIVFAGLGGLSRQTVLSEYHAPCPGRRRRR